MSLPEEPLVFIKPDSVSGHQQETETESLNESKLLINLIFYYQKAEQVKETKSH